MSSEVRLPGYLRFAWMFFMQPISLHHRLKECGIEKPDEPGWRLWRDLRQDPDLRQAYLGRLVATLALMPAATFAAAWCLQSVGSG